MNLLRIYTVLVCLLVATGCGVLHREQGFVKLFDRATLNGWTMVGGWGPGYGITNGILYCAKGTGGNFFTVKEYSNFVLRLNYRLTPGANNGVGIRAPYEGTPAYTGMEIQILDDTAPQYANLHPGQFNGSIYEVVPAKRGALRPVGDWNSEEIVADGPHIKVILNGIVIVDTNLEAVTDPALLEKHPGLRRKSGHIGLLSHLDYVEFRNIQIKELPPMP